MKESKYIKLKDGQECLVQTLREWVNERMTQIRRSLRTCENDEREENLQGRLIELSIIREKINDGRITEIG